MGQCMWSWLRHSDSTPAFHKHRMGILPYSYITGCLKQVLITRTTFKSLVIRRTKATILWINKSVSEESLENRNRSQPSLHSEFQDGEGSVERRCLIRLNNNKLLNSDNEYTIHTNISDSQSAVLATAAEIKHWPNSGEGKGLSHSLGPSWRGVRMNSGQEQTQRSRTTLPYSPWFSQRAFSIQTRTTTVGWAFHVKHTSKNASPSDEGIFLLQLRLGFLFQVTLACMKLIKKNQPNKQTPMFHPRKLLGPNATTLRLTEGISSVALQGFKLATIHWARRNENKKSNADMTIPAQLISQLTLVIQQEKRHPWQTHRRGMGFWTHSALGESDEELRLDTTAVMLCPLSRSSTSQKNK